MAANIDWTDTAIKLAMATAIATWSVFLKRWLENPSARNSDAKTAKNVLQKTGQTLKRLLISPWFFPLLNVLIGALDLWRHSRGVTLVTPRFVIDIAWDMCSITYGVLMYCVLSIWETVKQHENLRGRMIDLIGRGIDNQGSTIKTIDYLLSQDPEYAEWKKQ